MSKTTLLELSKLAGAIPGRGDKINWPSLEGSADGSGSAKQDQLSPPNALRLPGRIAVGGGECGGALGTAQHSGRASECRGPESPEFQKETKTRV